MKDKIMKTKLNKKIFLDKLDQKELKRKEFILNRR